MKKIMLVIAIVGFLAAVVFPTATMRFADRRWTPDQVMAIFSHLLTPAHQELLRARLAAVEQQEKLFNGGTLSSNTVLDILSVLNSQVMQEQQAQ